MKCLISLSNAIHSFRVLLYIQVSRSWSLFNSFLDGNQVHSMMIKCLAQRHRAVSLGLGLNLEPLNLKLSILLLSHYNCPPFNHRPLSVMIFLSCVCYAFVRVCLYVPCGHLLGKGCPLGSRLWCLTVSLSLSHWYPGSRMVLDCIDS